MDRRHFIKSAAALGAATVLPASAFSGPGSGKYKLGLQLYTVHDDMVKNPIATLTAVKSMGYQDFETFGFDDEKGTFYGYKSPEFRKIMDDLQLTVSSGHFGFAPYLNEPEDKLKRFVNRCIDGARTLGMKYITWPWLAPDQRSIDHFKLLAQKLNVIGEWVTSAGLGFAYHNHGFEFVDHHGENGFEIILSETESSLVKLQMDMYWVVRSSTYTPKELVRQQPGRYVMWHIKDMDKVTGDYTELGNGVIDYPRILPDPTESGLEFYYLEQGGNYAHSPLKSVADSAAFFRQRLQAYL